MDGFLTAFARADTAAMGACYGDEVRVLQRSRLLEKRYGLSDGDPVKSVLVKRDNLLKAYQEAIKNLGGVEAWQERGKELVKVERIQVTMDSEGGARYFRAAEALPDDVLVIVNPKGDEIVVVLRKAAGGKWLVVGEHWN